MTEDELTIIRVRQEHAQNAMTSARLLAENELWRDCVNRLYYACFYEVSALLLTRGLTSTKHSGVRSLFNRDFVKPGIVSAESGRFYNIIFDERQESDYADLHPVEPEKVSPWIKKTSEFIEEIDSLIDSEISGL